MDPLRTASVVFAAAAVLAGCDMRWNQAHDTPLASALPGVPRPVGPVPGPRGAAPPPENPYGQDMQAVWAGRQLFVRMNCSGCHGGRAGGGMGPSLRDPDWVYGKQAADIFDSIAQGRAHGMPAWGTQLPQQQIWQLVSYIQSLNTPHEPARPQ
jgi:cytochrome c oxidase cbb3-type subunit 3